MINVVEARMAHVNVYLKLLFFFGSTACCSSLEGMSNNAAFCAYFSQKKLLCR